MLNFSKTFLKLILVGAFRTESEWTRCFFSADQIHMEHCAHLPINCTFFHGVSTPFSSITSFILRGRHTHSSSFYKTCSFNLTDVDIAIICTLKVKVDFMLWLTCAVWGSILWALPTKQPKDWLCYYIVVVFVGGFCLLFLFILFLFLSLFYFLFCLFLLQLFKTF